MRYPSKQVKRSMDNAFLMAVIFFDHLPPGGLGAACPQRIFIKLINEIIS